MRCLSVQQRPPDNHALASVVTKVHSISRKKRYKLLILLGLRIGVIIRVSRDAHTPVELEQALGLAAIRLWIFPVIRRPEERAKDDLASQLHYCGFIPKARLCSGSRVPTHRKKQREKERSYALGHRHRCRTNRLLSGGPYAEQAPDLGNGRAG